MAAAAGAVQACAEGVDRTAEDGLRGSGRYVAARTVARLGGRPARRRRPTPGRHSRPGADRAEMGRAQIRPAELAAVPLERADVRGLAAPVFGLDGQRLLP